MAIEVPASERAKVVVLLAAGVIAVSPTPLTAPKQEGSVVDAATAKAIDQKSLPAPSSADPTNET